MNTVLISALLMVLRPAAAQAPEDDEPTSPTVAKWCGKDTDCNLVGAAAVAGARCIEQLCQCSGEMAPLDDTRPGIGCVRVGEPKPSLESLKTSLLAEYEWTNVDCESLPATFDAETAALAEELRKETGAGRAARHKKCGSVHVTVELGDVSLATAAAADVLQLFNDKVQQHRAVLPSLAALGAPDVADVKAGSSPCPVVFPAVEAAELAGKCQPTKCALGFVLHSVGRAEASDDCRLPVLPVLPVVPAVVHDSDDDDELGGAAVAAITIGTIGGVGIIALIIYFAMCRQAPPTDANVLNKNEPDGDDIEV